MQILTPQDLEKRLELARDSARRECIPDEEREVLEGRIRKKYRQYNAVIHLADNGYSPEEISRRAGASLSRVKDWLDGGMPLYFGHPYIKNKYQPSTEENIHLAYVLGSYASQTAGHETESPIFSMETRQKEVADRALYHGEALLGKSMKIRIGHRGQYVLEMHHRELIRFLINVTEKNSRLPWEHVYSAKERDAYLQGFLDRGHCVTTVVRQSVRYPRLSIDRNCTPEFKLDFLQLLAYKGIYPWVKECNKMQLIISELSQLEKIAEVLPASSKKKLTGLVRDAPQKQGRNKVYTLDDYLGFSATEWGRTSPAEIARRTGLPLGTVGYWLHGRSAPLVVKRYEKIKKLLAGRPDPNHIGYAYRHLRPEGGFARNAAAMRTMEELKLAAMLYGLVGKVYEDDTMLPGERFLKRMQTRGREAARAAVERFAKDYLSLRYPDQMLKIIMTRLLQCGVAENRIRRELKRASERVPDLKQYLPQRRQQIPPHELLEFEPPEEDEAIFA